MNWTQILRNRGSRILGCVFIAVAWVIFINLRSTPSSECFLYGPADAAQRVFLESPPSSGLIDIFAPLSGEYLPPKTPDQLEAEHSIRRRLREYSVTSPKRSPSTSIFKPVVGEIPAVPYFQKSVTAEPMPKWMTVTFSSPAPPRQTFQDHIFNRFVVHRFVLEPSFR